MSQKHYAQYFKYCPDIQDPTQPLTEENREWLSDRENVVITEFLKALPESAEAKILCSEDDGCPPFFEPGAAKVHLFQGVDFTNLWSYHEFVQETEVGPVFFYMVVVYWPV